MSYTPGPWTGRSTGSTFPFTVESQFGPIASVYRWDDVCLITASPDLLEAAREVLKGGEHEGECDEMAEYDGCEQHLETAARRMDALRHAVAKAEGREQEGHAFSPSSANPDVCAHCRGQDIDHVVIEPRDQAAGSTTMLGARDSTQPVYRDR